MSFLFWGFAVAMLFAAAGFIVIPLKTGKPIFGNPVALASLFIPLAAVGLYAMLGSPDAVTIESARGNHVPGTSKNEQSARSVATVDSLVDGLIARLQDEPDDAGGWLLLAKSYQHLGRNAEGIEAYRRAQSLGKTDVNLEATLFGASLANEAVQKETGPALRGRVALSPEATAQVRPGDTVFIFAKESRDQRMPVVALRKPVTDLPIDFVLTDKEVMVPGSRLTDFDELVVTAKISRSGSATDNSQGLEAWSEPTSPLNGGRIDLIISKVPEIEGADNE